MVERIVLLRDISYAKAYYIILLCKSKTPLETKGVNNQHIFNSGLCFFLLLCKALAAVNRSVLTRLKGNLCNSTAGIAGCFKPLTLATGCVLACITACLATLGFVNETFLSIEFLFTGCENEFVATFLTDESLVFVHDF